MKHEELLAGSRTRLSHLLDALSALLDGRPDSAWRSRPAPGRWSPLEIVCHLRDEEVEDFRARFLVALANGNGFAPIRPAEWVVERAYNQDDPRAALSELASRRAESLRMLASVEPGQLSGAVTTKHLGTLSALDLLAAWAMHDLLHLRQLTTTLAQLDAVALAPLRLDYAGDIPPVRA